MKNYITEEQALAVVKEGKEQGIDIFYEELCPWGGYIANEEERHDPDRPWSHILLGVSGNKHVGAFKRLLTKHGVELDLSAMENATTEDDYDRIVQNEGTDEPYYYTAEDGTGLDIAFCRDYLRRAVWSANAEQMAQYKVEPKYIGDGSMPLWKSFEVWVNGEPYAHAEAKVYEVGSEYGLNGGRVSKLGLFHRDPYTHLVKEWLCHYDRDWDTEPKTDKDRACVLAILTLFDGKKD